MTQAEQGEPDPKPLWQEQHISSAAAWVQDLNARTDSQEGQEETQVTAAGM